MDFAFRLGDSKCKGVSILSVLMEKYKLLIIWTLHR